MADLLDRLRDALAPGYVVERLLASGGMGSVFLARDSRLDRHVAIKILAPDLAIEGASERFRREARVLASLKHPGIVPVYQAGEADGFSWYVMEYIEGETLAERLKRGPVPVREALKLTDELLSALECAHESGVVHRDVKPANIFQVEHRAMLVDFGIAKRTEDASEPLTATRHQVGTLGYMPPEQYLGDPVTLATDIYAAGMILYEMLTGRRWSILNPTAEVDWSGVPESVSPVLRRALEWSPADRWPSASSFREALLEPAGSPAVGRAPANRRIALKWATLAIGLAGLGAGAVLSAQAMLDARRSASAVDTSPHVVATPESGIERFFSGDLAGAAEVLEAVAANPDNVSPATLREVLRYLVRAYDGSGHADKATDAMRRLLDLEPPVVLMFPTVETENVMAIYYDLRRQRAAEATTAPPSMPETGAVEVFGFIMRGETWRDPDTGEPLDVDSAGTVTINGVPAPRRTLGEGAGEMVMGELLTRLPDWKFVDRTFGSLENGYDVYRLIERGDSAVARWIKPTHLLLGSISLQDRQVLLSASIYDAETGTLVHSAHVVGSQQKLYELVLRLADELAAGMRRD